MRSLLIQRCLAARKGPAVVARHHHNGILELAQTFQPIEQLASLTVEALHRQIVIANILANDLVVGKIRRNTDVPDPDATVDSALPFVLAMGIGAAKPEAEWF